MQMASPVSSICGMLMSVSLPGVVPGQREDSMSSGRRHSLQSLSRPSGSKFYPSLGLELTSATGIALMSKLNLSPVNSLLV